MADEQTTTFSPAQMTRDAARSLFDYQADGRLLWRDQIGRRRPEAGSEVFRKRTDDGPVWMIRAGGRDRETRYLRRYLVWNWHFGGTDRVLLPKNGNTLDDRIENIMLGNAAVSIGGLQTLQCAPPPETGIPCPCCGSVTNVLSPNLLARALQLPPQQEAILTRVWNGKGKTVPAETIIADMYADDIDGGPEHETARKYFKTQLCLLRKRIEGSGVRIEASGYQRGFRIVIDGQSM